MSGTTAGQAGCRPLPHPDHPHRSLSTCVRNHSPHVRNHSPPDLPPPSPLQRIVSQKYIYLVLAPVPVPISVLHECELVRAACEQRHSASAVIFRAVEGAGIAIGIALRLRGAQHLPCGVDEVCQELHLPAVKFTTAWATDSGDQAPAAAAAPTPSTPTSSSSNSTVSVCILQLSPAAVAHTHLLVMCSSTPTETPVCWPAAAVH